MALKENLFESIIFFYGIFNKDFKYTPSTRQKEEMAHLKYILRKINEHQLAEICRYVNEYKSEWRTMSKIHSNLDDLIVLIVKYPENFELDEGYKYFNLVDKKNAYKKWREDNNENIL